MEGAIKSWALGVASPKIIRSKKWLRVEPQQHDAKIEPFDAGKHGPDDGGARIFALPGLLQFR